MGLIVFLGIVAVIGLLTFSYLISKKNQVKNSFAGMDVQLKMRYDMIPNLVDLVKEHMHYEKGTLEEITKLRTKALSKGLEVEERVLLNNQITDALGYLKVSLENYPELLASKSFQNLNRALIEVEAQLSAARRSYNAAVTDYNNAIEMIPGRYLSGFMGLSRKVVFTIPDAKKEKPNMKKLFLA